MCHLIFIGHRLKDFLIYLFYFSDFWELIYLIFYFVLESYYSVVFPIMKYVRWDLLNLFGNYRTYILSQWTNYNFESMLAL